MVPLGLDQWLSRAHGLHITSQRSVVAGPLSCVGVRNQLDG